MLASPGASAETAEGVARQIEQRHARVTDLTARFVQTYRSGMLGREVTESGHVSIKRPGRMLWEYRDPEKKTFVSDGSKLYFYVPADKQVVVRDQAGERGLPALLLSGRGHLLEDFEATLLEPADGAERLQLRPRKQDPEIEQVILELDPEHRIRGIDVLDSQGNRSNFRFEDIRENTGLPDRLFRFEVPRGVEVVAG